MRHPIKLYVSAGPDLEAERDVIGQVVAGLPITLGWEIGRTPWPGQEMSGTSVHVTPYNCDFFVFLLGRDITAPAGSEWREAQTVRHPILPLLKRVPRSPAGLAFQHLGAGLWVPFTGPADVARRVRPWLIRHLLDRQQHFGLLLPEVEALLGLGALEPEHVATDSSQSAGAGQGAGGAGVILAGTGEQAEDGD